MAFVRHVSQNQVRYPSFYYSRTSEFDHIDVFGMKGGCSDRLICVQRPPRSSKLSKSQSRFVSRICASA